MTTTQLLQRGVSDPRFESVSREAMSLLNASLIDRINGPSGPGQSSRSLADLHEFRKKSKYYKAIVPGLDETISSLKEHDRTVHSRVIELDGSFIAVWLDSQDDLAGIMIFRKAPD